ncbi:hypothetical protein M3A94_009115 [Micrococcus luteus]|nr:hypothetical protein [Micrococcus luteus]
MVNLLLSVTFACGVAIAGLHVVNRRFIAPMYDVVLNLAAFLAAVASSVLLGHVLPAVFAALAVLAWLILAVRTVRARRAGHKLEVTAGRLVAVDTRPSKADGRIGLRFLFRAVHPLTAADVAAIRLQEDEASEHRFVTCQEARKLLRPAIARRVDAAWDAAHCVYLEDGCPAAGVDQPAG